MLPAWRTSRPPDTYCAPRISPTLAEICFAVGLQSIGSFTTSFTRTFGKSPTAYAPTIRPRRTWPACPPASSASTPDPNAARFEKTTPKCPPSIGNDLFR